MRLSQVSTLKEQLQHEIRRRQPSFTNLPGASWERRRPVGQRGYYRHFSAPAAEILPCITLWPSRIFNDQNQQPQARLKTHGCTIPRASVSRAHVEDISKAFHGPEFSLFSWNWSQAEQCYCVLNYVQNLNEDSSVAAKYSSALCTMGPLVSTLFSVCWIII